MTELKLIVCYMSKRHNLTTGTPFNKLVVDLCSLAFLVLSVLSNWMARWMLFRIMNLSKSELKPA